MCCSPERWSTPEGNGDLCARRSTRTPPRSDYHPKPSPLKESNVTTTSRGRNEQRRRQSSGRAGTRARAAVHTLLLADLLDVEAVAGCRARLGALAVLHPNWTLGDWETRRETQNMESPFKSRNSRVLSPQADLTALALLQPSVQKHPVRVASASVLQQDGAVTVFGVTLATVTHLPLTEFQECFGRHQVCTVEEDRGCSEQAAAGQDLQHKHFFMYIK